MVERHMAKKVQTVYFVALAALMYYFLQPVIDLGIYVTYRHAFALLIAVSGFVCFLFKPNLARFSVSIKSALVYSLPLLVMLTSSLWIWLNNRSDFAVIARGLSGHFITTNIFSCALAAVVFLYIFGEKGIWYNLLSIIIANLLMILTIIQQHGASRYLAELGTLVKTFAGETGEIIVQAEIHELAFCLGAYLIYMLLFPRKKQPMFWILLVASAFCFVSAFKRIAILAIVVALLLGWMLCKIAKKYPKSASRLISIFLTCIVVLLIAYIAAIKMDVFTTLEKAGISTNGRAEIYRQVDKFYEFSPQFIGNGMGFLTYQLSTYMHIGVTAVHNDFLQFYIDLGFFGYIAWLIAMTFVRTQYFGRRGKTENAIVAFVITLYLLIVSATDNTMNYPLVTTVVAMLMIGHGYDDRVRAEEERLCGYAYDPALEKKGY